MKLHVMRVLIALVLLSSLSVPAFAVCDGYRCRYSVDTASCEMVFGPLGRRLRQATGCSVYENCMWNYSEALGGWTMSCQYECRYDDCYFV